MLLEYFSSFLSKKETLYFASLKLLAFNHFSVYKIYAYTFIWFLLNNKLTTVGLFLLHAEEPGFVANFTYFLSDFNWPIGSENWLYKSLTFSEFKMLSFQLIVVCQTVRQAEDEGGPIKVNFSCNGMEP